MLRTLRKFVSKVRSYVEVLNKLDAAATTGQEFIKLDRDDIAGIIELTIIGKHGCACMDSDEERAALVKSIARVMSEQLVVLRPTSSLMN